MASITPIGSRVLLRPLNKTLHSYGDIILPEKVDELLTICLVEAWGPKVKNELIINQEVLIQQYSGTPFKYKDEDYIMVEEAHILGGFQ